MSETRPVASPVCYADEADAAYAGYLTDAELCQLLVQIHAYLAAGSDDGDVTEEIAHHIVRLGGEIGRPLEPVDRSLPDRARADLSRIRDDAVFDAVRRALERSPAIALDKPGTNASDPVVLPCPSGTSADKRGTKPARKAGTITRNQALK